MDIELTAGHIRDIQKGKLNKTDRKDLARYEKYVRQGHKEFIPCLEYFAGIKKDRISEKQKELRDIVVYLRNRGYRNQDISEICDVHVSVLSSLIHSTNRNISDENAVRAIKKLKKVEKLS